MLLLEAAHSMEVVAVAVLALARIQHLRGAPQKLQVLVGLAQGVEPQAPMLLVAQDRRPEVVVVPQPCTVDLQWLHLARAPLAVYGSGGGRRPHAIRNHH